jgi:DNA-binding transcriptional ArsR family regulator
MPPIRRGGDTPPLAIEVGPAYEFLMSITTLAEESHREVAEIGPAWFDDVERRAGRVLMERLRAFAIGSGDAFIHLIGLAYDAPTPRDAPTFIEHVEGIDAEALSLQMVGYYDYHYRRTTPPEVMRRAVAGDEEAIAEFLRTTEMWTEWRAFLEGVLRRGAASTKRDLVRILRGWNERVWQREWTRIAPILERDAEAKRLLANELPFERFVEVATNGVEFVAHPGIERVVLIPSYVNRPWVSNTEHRGALILVYPVADESIVADGDAPPLRLVRLSKALADEKRLRILRALAERQMTLMELAERFGVPKTTMHHHMVTLRSAGLVTIGAGMKQYRLRHDTLPDVGQLLSGYLGAASPSPAPGPAGGERQSTTAPASTPTRRPTRRRGTKVASRR